MPLSPLATLLQQLPPTGSMSLAGLVARHEQQQSVMETVTAAIAANPNFTTALAAAISSVMAGAAHQAQPTPRAGNIGSAGEANGSAGGAAAGPTAAGAYGASGGSPRFATQSACTTSTT
jgi:hypothetical protein